MCFENPNYNSLGSCCATCWIKEELGGGPTGCQGLHTRATLGLGAAAAANATAHHPGTKVCCDPLLYFTGLLEGGLVKGRECSTMKYGEVDCLPKLI